MNWKQFKILIMENLSDDFLSKEWQQKKLAEKNPHSTYGHCYLATEAAYHLLGGREEGWKPYHLKQSGESHWFLKHNSGALLDLTADQFDGVPIRYDLARGKGFLTRDPSKRAKRLILKIRQSSTWQLVKLFSP